MSGQAKRQPTDACPDCETGLDSASNVSRRAFLKSGAVASAAAACAGSLPWWAQAAEGSPDTAPETIVKALYDTLSDTQKQAVCFAWDHTDKRGLLRTRVENNWHITKPDINSDFYTKDQQVLVRKIFEGIIQPEWHKRIDKQLEDDAGGFGNDQNIAIFGAPGSDKFELVMTGRHMTLRCDGNTTDHVAFGGPIFYGHAAQGFNEKADHPGNVFWPQAVAANKVYEMLDEKQRQESLVAGGLPAEKEVGFRGTAGGFPGIAVSSMSSDQKELVQEVLRKLIEPYRQGDQEEALRCLAAQGGLDKCSLAFYKGGDVGKDQVWDCWRLEGPSFVWYYRGDPHVHVWVNVADDPSVKTNTGLLGQRRNSRLWA